MFIGRHKILNRSFEDLTCSQLFWLGLLGKFYKSAVKIGTKPPLKQIRLYNYFMTSKLFCYIRISLDLTILYYYLSSYCPGQEDGSILLYDITAGRTLHTMRLHKNDCRSVRFSPDSNYLMTASYDASISLMHIRADLEWNPPRHYSVAQHVDKVIQCRWHPHENLLLSSSADRTSILWKGSDL